VDDGDVGVVTFLDGALATAQAHDFRRRRATSVDELAHRQTPASTPCV
jgi:hypothetical protein